MSRYGGLYAVVALLVLTQNLADLPRSIKIGIVLGIILPSLRPSGHSVLIWLQRQFWLLVTQPDPWRLSYEMPSARPSKVATEKTAARNATKTLPAVSSESN